MKRFCERLRESGLADAGNVFDEQMAAREQSDERELDGVFLAVDGAEAARRLEKWQSACVENPGPSCYK